MAEFIKKITFKYKKKDGEETVRNILAPKFLKESFNSFKELEKEQVNYISGYEIESEGMDEDEIKEYEESICDYFTLALPTMEEYLKDLGLNPDKVKQKSFKKDGVLNYKIIKDE
jgi:hypothetical protein